MTNKDAKKQLERVRDALDRAISEVTERKVEHVLQPFDGLPRLRPHGPNGAYGWQLWSGSLCVALLSHEDTQPVIDAAEATE